MTTTDFATARAELEAVLVAQIEEADSDFVELREWLEAAAEVTPADVAALDATTAARSRLVRKLAFVRDLLADEAIVELIGLAAREGYCRCAARQGTAARVGARTPAVETH